MRRAPIASSELPAPSVCLQVCEAVVVPSILLGYNKRRNLSRSLQVSEGEGTGQGPRGVGSVEGTARAELGAPLPTSQHIYTHSAMLSKRREKWQGLSGKWLAHVCTRNGGVEGGKKAH